MVEKFANNASTTLASGINNSVTAIPLISSQQFSAVGNFRIVIDSELMLVTANNTGTNTLTVVRGQEGTSAVSHSSGATVAQIITAAAIAQMKTDTVTIRGLTSTQTSTYNVNNTDDIVLFSSTGGSFNIFLPSIPNTGESHVILDVGGMAVTNPVTVSGNGKNVVTSSGLLASSDVINTNYGSVTYMYNGTFWSVI